MVFISPEHRNRFIAAISNIGKIYNGKFDPEYASALFILTAHLGTWKKTRDYVDNHGISFEEILKDIDFSGGYSVLIKLASNLFNGNEHIDPLEFLRLDDANFELAISAIRMRRDGYSTAQAMRDELAQEEE